jgi:hypothetical protein
MSEYIKRPYMFPHDVSMNALHESIQSKPVDTDGKLTINICIKTGEFTPLIRYGTDPEDTFGWVINKQYTTNKFTIPGSVLGGEDIPLSSKAFIDSYMCPHKYKLEVRHPYYRGEKYDTVMTLELTPDTLMDVATTGYVLPVYAHGFHSNCNTIFYDAISPHISHVDKIRLVNIIMTSHKHNIID